MTAFAEQTTCLKNRKRDYIRTLARRRYDYYLEYVYRDAYCHAAHTRLICKKLSGLLADGNKRIMLFLPPRHGKSMTVTESFPSYFLLRKPDKHVIVTGYGNDLAQKFGRENRKKIAEFGRELFGLTLSAEKSAMTYWELEKHSGGMLATTMEGGATGHGADLLIIDDPIKNALEANSRTYRDRLYDEYQATFRTRLHAGGSIILIQTRWHEDDLAGRLLQLNDERWDVIGLPAVCDSTDDPLGRTLNEPLWPKQGFDLNWAEQTKKNVGSYVWEAMYQQRPSAPEGGIFKRGWWQRWRALPADLFDYIQSWDCAFKDADTSDFVVGQVWARSRKNPAQRYLLDQVRGRMSFTETVNAVRELSAKWKQTNRKLIEDKANGTAVIEVLRKQIAGLVPVEPMGGKVVRAQAVTAVVEAGNVFIPDASVVPWVNDFIEEFAAFPYGLHDDQVDAMTQANSYYNEHSGGSMLGDSGEGLRKESAWRR